MTKPRRLLAKYGAMRREARAQRRRGGRHGRRLSGLAFGPRTPLPTIARPRSATACPPATLSVIVITKNEAANGSTPASRRWPSPTSGSSSIRAAATTPPSGRAASAPGSSSPPTGPASAPRSSAPSTAPAAAGCSRIDADERVDAGAGDEHPRRRSPPPATAPAAYELSRLSRFGGRWIRHGDWYPDRVLRLFRRERGPLLRRPGARAASSSTARSAGSTASCCTTPCPRSRTPWRR